MKRTKILYLEIADKIKNDIISGKYPVGSLLPTETELETLFQVSKITVRKAIELLAADEYVEKKSGKGTTVLSNRPYNKLSKAASFSQVLQKSNLELSTRPLSLEKVKLKPEDPLFASFGKEVLIYRRLYLLEGKPYIYFIHHLPSSLAHLGLESFAKMSLYRLLNLEGYEIDSFKDDFLAISLSKEDQEILETKEPIGLKRMRKSLDAKEQLVEYSVAVYNTNQQPYHIEYET